MTATVVPGMNDDRPQAATYRDRWGTLTDDLDWLWPGWLPAGCVVAVEGDAGTGKSSVVLDVVARLTTGAAMPGDVHGSHYGDPLDAVIVAIGDDPTGLTRGRLRVARADPSRLHHPTFRHVVGDVLTLPDDLWRLEWVVRDVGARAVVVIDPLVAVLASGDPFLHRRVLTALGRIAEKSAATVLVTSHGVDADAVRAGARVMWHVTHGEGQARTLRVVKSSVGPRPPSLPFRLAGSGPGDPHVVEPARVEW